MPVPGWIGVSVDWELKTDGVGGGSLRFGVGPIRGGGGLEYLPDLYEMTSDRLGITNQDEALRR